MRTNRVLWTMQGLLAALFLFAGGAKLVLPLDAMAGPIAMPGWFLRFIGVAELLGAVGLILPGLLHIRTELTPVAASGLVIIMIGATTLTAMSGPLAGAMFPAIVGALCATVIAGRKSAWTAALA